jgi:hypothetical protein
MGSHPLFQEVRPSWHSAVVMASHVAFLLSLRTALRQRQFPEFAALLLSLAISLGYHLCDENVKCSLEFDIVKWHALDVWSTFFFICFVVGVRALGLSSRAARGALRGVYLLLVTAFVVIDRGSVAMAGGLLALVTMSLVVRYLLFPLQRGSPQYLLMGLGTFSVSLGCFVVANTPMVGPVTWTSHAGELKPMHLPDTAVYWAFHSVWHFASAVSAHCLLKFTHTGSTNRRSKR